MTGRVALAFASAGYSGFFPFAPGTVGSAVGVALWWGMRMAGATVAIEVAVVFGLLVTGALAATRAERVLGTTDPGPVVVDEVMGMCVTLVGAPLTWPTALAGFVLFRGFDIVKPPPARQLERAHGGWGIMLDDLAAGVYAWGVLRMALWLAPGWLA
ncbi:MAG: phosphatidylglycerophosphatase A [Acidobacteria bacterium]|nr:phosphatidylglycerophosphatase A [Acidobacteriota bacterium]